MPEGKISQSSLKPPVIQLPGSLAQARKICTSSRQISAWLGHIHQQMQEQHLTAPKSSAQYLLLNCLCSYNTQRLGEVLTATWISL